MGVWRWFYSYKKLRVDFDKYYYRDTIRIAW
jgi:hypothetical protein